ncbi:MAG: response regulator transcription factor [Elusimicrobiota bacterium]
MQETILVVDDEEDIVELIKVTLEKEDYKVITSSSADAAMQEIEKSKPDLIILDLKLPGISGLELCKILKSRQDTQGIPIIMLTGKYVKPEERAGGIELGSDDYMTKPFYGGELTARVKAVLRRGEYKAGEDKIIKIEGEIPIEINLPERTVNCADKMLNLTPKEFDLLVFIVKRKNKVLSREIILESVWGFEYFGTTRTVDMHIARLRSKLGPAGKRIQTVETIGYKFV